MMSKYVRSLLLVAVGLMALWAIFGLSTLPEPAYADDPATEGDVGEPFSIQRQQAEPAPPAPLAPMQAAPTPTPHPFETEVIDLVNQRRTQYGLPTLRADGRLMQSSDNHNAAMIAAGVLSHQVSGELPLCAQGPNNDRYDTVGYPWVACSENIARGQSSPQTVMNAWMASTGHCLDILAPNVRDIGVVYTLDGNNRAWWTQNFGAQPGQGGPQPTATTTANPGPCPVTQQGGTATRTPTPSRTPTPGPATDKPALYRQGTWLLRNSLSSGAADTTVGFGMSSDIPLMCDWDGNGTRTIGVYRPANAAFYLRNTNTAGNADIAILFGSPSDVPVCGDWDGDGDQTVGIFRPSTAALYLRNSNTSGPADLVFLYGQPGDVFVSGDWNGDGVDSVGIRRGTTWFLKNSNANGPADLFFDYGMASDVPITGDWDGDGDDTPGIYRSGVWYVRNSNTAGPADLTFSFGASGDKPLVWR